MDIHPIDSFISLLACPLCNAHFTRRQTTLVCANSHAFDIAREGYVNLLRKKLLGDTKEMLLARRSFFDQGYYQPVSDVLNKLIAGYVPEDLPDLRILDAGCGEGYYLNRLRASLSARSQNSLCLGIDVSKDAIRLAARRYSESLFLVANLKERLVLQDATIQIMLNVFSPRNAQEYARVLSPSALLLVVIPGPNHLHQLRSTLHLLNIEESKEQHVIEQFSPLFSLLTTQTLSYTLDLQQPDISQLVMMTPNYWHLSLESRLALDQLQKIQTTIDMTFLLFQR
jgi:23S rRNA (guanine745-N1)-methyltransferase